MFLQEEYLKRHNLQNVNVINYVTNGSVLLKTGPYRYMLMTITWADNSSRPGRFYIDFKTPAHNSYETAPIFSENPDNRRILEWDEYIDYLIRWRDNNEFAAVVGDKEVVLATWEIFIYCCDGWLAKHLFGNLEKLIFISIDDNKPFHERFPAYQELIFLINTEFPELSRFYKHGILPHVNNYCHWFARLINNKNFLA